MFAGTTIPRKRGGPIMKSARSWRILAAVVVITGGVVIILLTILSQAGLIGVS